ncbi:hypothetical protein A2572_00660 [Candidatus Collierbacteria bacterium RIFOXYD1_FULL_40_9]|uniref:Uncharacterized protein n=1 Tax=Candidatus Collierbacteria bacterium RIFOXYD1_FULL_40_9 TaxID=1817731 RepID=A0A1F5FWN3_9BACT|nr:MAG: hypothetical protein A2572_00660 [Candidatus Collierbacteria bacterium RIFOXYD1_FULL_40_9]
MAYYSYVVDRALIRARYRCEVCDAHWTDFPKVPGDAPIDVHSATSYHLMMFRKTGLFKSISPPRGHSRMKGKLYRPSAFMFYQYFPDRLDDAFCFCNSCHLTVHDKAEAESLVFLGGVKELKNDVPTILEYVTVMSVLTKGKWTP